MREPGTGATLASWVATWRAAGRALAAVKQEELSRLDTTTAQDQLEDAFAYALQHARATTTSGLVEQQRLLGRLRR